MKDRFPPLVSICVTSFNLEKYIGGCLDSILQQEVTFSYEIVIGDDGSTDSTRKILQEYKDKYPDLIRLQLNTLNLGMTLNVIKLVESVGSRYVAIMDGDDVWVETTKLQKQFNFLENNSEYSLVFHDAFICNSDLIPIKNYSEQFKRRVTSFNLDDIIYYQGVLGATSSIFFRKTFNKFNPLYYKMEGCVERIFFYYLRQFGEYKYLSECMSKYRTHSSSYMSAVHKITFRENNLNTNKSLLLLFPEFGFYFSRKIILNRLLLIKYNFLAFKIKEIFIHGGYLILQDVVAYFLTFFRVKVIKSFRVSHLNACKE